jgi:hypothetical protein
VRDKAGEIATANFREFFHALGCIKKPGPDLLDPGSSRINFGLWAVPSVHVAYARALVGVAEILPVPFLALILRRRQGGADVQAPAGQGARITAGVVDDVELPGAVGVGAVEYFQ